MSSIAVIAGVVVAGAGVAGAMSSNKKPATAALTQDSPQTDQMTAIQGNINAEPQIESMMGQANSWQQSQALSLANQATPGLSNSISSLMQTSQSDLANQYNLPPAVQKQLEQQAAEQNTMVGNTGQGGGFNSLRSLGVNELAYGQQQFQNALSSLSTAVGLSPRVSPVSPMSFYVTPQQQTSQQMQQNQLNQQITQGSNNAKTAASNAENAGIWSSIGQGAGMAMGGIGGIGGAGAGAAAGAGGSSAGAAGSAVGGAML
jgi:hypothetical protein